MMRKIIVFSLLVFLMVSCANYKGGELVGVQGRKSYFEPVPFGMVWIPMGSFNMGPTDQDISWSMNSDIKTVSVDAFWMDETEVTNNEYRQFVHWVRDSLIRSILGEAGMEEYVITEDAYGNPIDPPRINWQAEINYENEEVKTILEDELYLESDERFYNAKEIDSRLLNYEYYWVDFHQASKRANRYNQETQQYEGQVVTLRGDTVDVAGRSSFIHRDIINVYPDTLVWIRDFSYSYNEPMAKRYFWHPAYDNYPVVGVDWKQARAFSIWRTRLINNYLAGEGQSKVHEYRLPTEAEWEYAARGGLDLVKYPWGGPYTRNHLGCFLANFKPLRGNYTDDGGLYTTRVGSYEPNDYGLYDMAGNVAEWTSNSYNESSYTFYHDMNPNYEYEAAPEDPVAMKRKVVRGGSWKDIGYFLQTGTRNYEYQDSAKSFIGFRCVRTYLGNS